MLVGDCLVSQTGKCREADQGSTILWFKETVGTDLHVLPVFCRLVADRYVTSGTATSAVI